MCLKEKKNKLIIKFVYIRYKNILDMIYRHYILQK